MLMFFFLYKLNSWHPDIKTPWQEEKEKRSSLRCQPAKFFPGYYGEFTAVLMCVFVKLWHWTSGPGWRPARCVWICQPRRYWWLPEGIGRRKVCVYELETVVPPQVMTTCAPSAWFMDTHDLSTLSWICSRTDRMHTNTPDDECFHFVQGAPLINYLDVSSNISLLLFLWQKKKKN